MQVRLDYRHPRLLVWGQLRKRWLRENVGLYPNTALVCEARDTLYIDVPCTPTPLREGTPLEFPQKTNLDFPSPSFLTETLSVCQLARIVLLDRQTRTGSVRLRRQATLCSSSGGQSALSQMVSSSQGGCSRLTHACIQAQTHVHACVHARVALASFAHGECSPCIQPHTRASKRRHACMPACVHAHMRHHGELCPWRAL